MNSITINNTTLTVGQIVLVNDKPVAIAAFAGRWVKLANGSSISRNDAVLAAAAMAQVAVDTKDIVKPSYREVYDRVKSASGNRSYDKGDELAKALRGLDADQIVDIAGFEPSAWSHLNPGQRSMNARNAIRNAIRKGTMTMKFVVDSANHARR